MELKDIVIILLLIIAIVFFILDLSAKNVVCKECPKPPTFNILDLEFSPANFPSAVYNDIFTGTNVFSGGYKLDGSVHSRLLKQK